MSNGRMKCWTPSCSLFTNGPAPRAPRFQPWLGALFGALFVRLSPWAQAFHRSQSDRPLDQSRYRWDCWDCWDCCLERSGDPWNWVHDYLPLLGFGVLHSNPQRLNSRIPLFKSGRWLFFSYPDPKILGPSRCQHHADDAGRCQADFPIALHFCAKVRPKNPLVDPIRWKYDSPRKPAQQNSDPTDKKRS